MFVTDNRLGFAYLACAPVQKISIDHRPRYVLLAKGLLIGPKVIPTVHRVACDAGPHAPVLKPTGESSPWPGPAQAGGDCELVLMPVGCQPLPAFNQNGEKEPAAKKSWRTELYSVRRASRCCFSQSARNW